MISRLGFIGLLSLFVAAAHAAAPEVDPSDLPRVPPTEPDKALSTFRIKPGFRLELVAAEPLVVSPVAMAFDENGWLFVVEMRDYSERRPERLGRIRLLEDTDGDGRFDKSTVFAEDLPWPTAVTCYDGGIFVGATPDIIYFKDTNGDGKADVREVVFTGFASDYTPYETNKLNVQALMNSFQWGLDNRIHGATGPSGGKVHLVDGAFTRRWRERAASVSPSPGGEGRGEGGKNPPRNANSNPQPLDLRGRDFSFDPRTLELRAESGGGQHGMSFDNRGMKFVCSNSDHIQFIAYEERYAARNPYFTMPSPRVSIAVDGPAAEVYRISPDEPWRVIRTKWRVAGQVPGPVEGGGRASGYFTGATGVTIYRGDAFGEEFVGDAFIADCGSNLVHRKKLRPDGVLLKAERPADEQKVEFLASTDNWFRPVQFANAPDGCLYVIDMYREIIEHPWSLPPSLKKHLDLNSGNDRGRIYRIVPENFKQPKLPRLGVAGTAELVLTLENPNGWQRDTAQRLLYERRDKSVAPALEQMLRESAAPLGELHALRVLDGLAMLRPQTLETVLTGSVPFVRQHAIQLAEKFLPELDLEFISPFGESRAPTGFLPPDLAVSPRLHLAQTVASLTASPDASVRFQLALALAALPRPQRLDAACAFVRRDKLDSWTRRALLNSTSTDAGELFSRLATNGISFRGDAEFFPLLVRVIGARNQADEVAAVIEWVSRLRYQSWGIRVAAELGEGLERAGSSFRQADPQEKLKSIFTIARKEATNGGMSYGPIPPSSDAIRLLGYGRYADAAPALFALLEGKHGRSEKRSALAALGRFSGVEVGEELIRRWPAIDPLGRGSALDLLLKRPEWINVLLDGLERGTVGPGDLSAAQTQFLRAHRDTRLRQRAVQVLGKAFTTSRQEVVDAFLPALKLSGDAKRGQAVYLNRCSACHRAGRQGHALGPDLISVKSAGKEKLLINILDPNREVAPNYVSYLIETKDGETLIGLIGNETAAGVTLRQANGVETVVLRSNIARMESQRQSVMPEGLEAGLSRQDLADLLKFITSL